jgi:hypothetical protein
MATFKASHHTCPERKKSRRRRYGWGVSENTAIVMEFFVERGKG